MMTYNDQTDDLTLLKGYCERGDGNAFEILVHRYAAMVCGVAHRLTGQRMLAEEATQNVFASLARKAEKLQSLEEGRLGSWLHRAAVLEARHLYRGEKRHERRVQQAAKQQITETGDTGQMRAEVDGALNELRPADRDVLVLRYYNELSFREIAKRLGKTEAAAQKQGRRALERLGVSLRDLGFAVPVTALTTFLGSGSSEAMTQASIAKISAAAMSAGSAGTTAVPLIPFGKLLLSGSAAALLIGIIVYQGSVLARDDSPQKPEDRKRAPLSALHVRDFTTDVSFEKADEVDLKALAEDLYRGSILSDHERSLRATVTLTALTGLDSEELKSLFGRATEPGLSQFRRHLLVSKLGEIVAEREPQWLLDYSLPKPESGRAATVLGVNSQFETPLVLAMQIWAGQDPVAAAIWLDQALLTDRISPTHAALDSGAKATIAVALSAAAWSKAQPTVEAILAKLPRKERSETLRELPALLNDDALPSFMRSDIVATERFAAVRILAGAAERFVARDWAEAENFADRLADAKLEKHFLNRVASRKWRFEQGNIAKGVDAMLAWTNEIGAEDRAGSLVGAALGSQEYLGENETWAQAKRVAREVDHGEEVIASYLVAAVGPTSPWRLLKLTAEELTDPQLRADVGYAAIVYMSSNNNTFQDGALEGNGFTQEEIELIRSRFEK